MPGPLGNERRRWCHVYIHFSKGWYKFSTEGAPALVDILVTQSAGKFKGPPLVLPSTHTPFK